MRPGNCSGSYSEPPRARAIALRSSSCPREVDATTFSIRNLAMGHPLGRNRGYRHRWRHLHATGGLYTSVRPEPIRTIERIPNSAPLHRSLRPETTPGPLSARDNPELLHHAKQVRHVPMLGDLAPGRQGAGIADRGGAA